jgi:hypothetical protein
VLFALPTFTSRRILRGAYGVTVWPTIPIRRLDKAWDEAIKPGSTVVDMKSDRKQVFPAP